MVILDLEIFENLKDEELVSLSRRGNLDAEEALIGRYSPFVRSFARKYFLAGGDYEDLIQEGMIGLIKAVSGFDPNSSASFKTFAVMCVKNRVYSALRQASSGKHTPLNNYVSLESSADDNTADGRIASVDMQSPSGDPAELIIGRESSNELRGALKGILSRFELSVLELYLEGLSYREISEKISKPQKSVDNAVTRIRRKFSQYLKSRGDIR